MNDIEKQHQEELNKQAELKKLAEEESEKKKQEDIAKVDEEENKEDTTPSLQSEIEKLKEQNKKLIVELNSARIKEAMKIAKINPNKEEWVRRLNSDLINDNDLIDIAKLGERLSSDEYESIKVFSGLNAKSTISNNFSGAKTLTNNKPSVSQGKPIDNSKEEWAKVISGFKQTFKQNENEIKK